MTVLCVAKTYDHKKIGCLIVMMREMKFPLNSAEFGYIRSVYTTVAQITFI